MVLPPPVYDPPFRITRASHVVLEVSDLDASQSFYADVLGLILTSRDETTLFFRGIEEACHHSLVLRRSDRQPACARIGMRVLTEQDLDRAEVFFSQRHCPTAWVEVPHQGRTLHITDPVGVPLELCAQMTAVPRMITEFEGISTMMPADNGIRLTAGTYRSASLGAAEERDRGHGVGDGVSWHTLAHPKTLLAPHPVAHSTKIST
jgi:catechol 2,3-dioxygenase-like lactoylglutathione lyase family enzyme